MQIRFHDFTVLMEFGKNCPLTQLFFLSSHSLSRNITEQANKRFTLEHHMNQNIMCQIFIGQIRQKRNRLFVCGLVKNDT